MSLSFKLWQANHDLAQACLDHPFVRGIADGTLADLSRPIEGAKTIKVGRKTFNTDEM